MPSAYYPIFILVALSAIVMVVVMNLPGMIAPRRSFPGKLTPYESGIRPIGPTRRRFHVSFHMIAMLFILFDIEVVFFYPWAVTFRQLGMFGFVEMLVFVALLLVGYVYVVKRGAFKWE